MLFYVLKLTSCGIKYRLLSRHPTCPRSPTRSTSCTKPKLRLHKAKNVLFFNINKPKSVDPQIALVTANDILKALDLQVPILSARWIGKDSLKSHSLLVEFNETRSVLKILKLKSKLQKTEKWLWVWTSPDLTPIQQNHMKKLRNELAHRREQSDTNLIIKYSNGIPSICSKN